MWHWSAVPKLFEEKNGMKIIVPNHTFTIMKFTKLNDGDIMAVNLSILSGLGVGKWSEGGELDLSVAGAAVP